MATREQQRARTRQAIVDAAGTLVGAGATDVSIDDIAAEAGVSRATTYRYFDSATDVLWQVFADQDIESSEDAMAGVDDVVERVMIAERLVNDFLFADPNGTRTFEHAMLTRVVNGTSLDSDRKARRLTFIDDALSPIADRLGDRAPAVRHALALAMGSQSVVALLDTCALSVDEARAATRFACRSIIESAVRELDDAAAGLGTAVSPMADAVSSRA